MYNMIQVSDIGPSLPFCYLIDKCEFRRAILSGDRSCLLYTCAFSFLFLPQSVLPSLKKNQNTIMLAIFYFLHCVSKLHHAVIPVCNRPCHLTC